MHLSLAATSLLPLLALAAPANRASPRDLASSSYLLPDNPAGDNPARRAGYFSLMLYFRSNNIGEDGTFNGTLEILPNDIIRDTRNGGFGTPLAAFYRECLVPIGPITISNKNSSRAIESVTWPDAEAWVSCSGSGAMQARIVGGPASNPTSFTVGVRHAVQPANSTSVVAREIVAYPATPFDEWISFDNAGQPRSTSLGPLGVWPDQAVVQPGWKGDAVPVSFEQLTGTPIPVAMPVPSPSGRTPATS